MSPDRQAFFERSDKWNYRLLLQELYRNCVLSLHDSYAFIDHVKKLNLSVCNFPGLLIRDMIDKLMIPFDKERHDATFIRILKYKKSHTTQALAASISFQYDIHDIESKYHHHLFDVLRDTLAKHGAFNLSKAEKEHGYELQE